MASTNQTTPTQSKAPDGDLAVRLTTPEGLKLFGTSELETAQFIEKLNAESIQAANEYFKDKPHATQAERDDYIHTYRQNGVTTRNINIIGSFLKQYEKEHVGKAKIDAITAYLKKYPDLAEDMAKQLYLVMKHGAELQQTSYAKAVDEFQHNYAEQMKDLIQRGINGVISPHEARIDMANLGVKAGMLIGGIGMLLGKDEWVETGTKLSNYGAEMADAEGREILRLKKELMTHYDHIAAPVFFKHLNDYKLNYGAEGQGVFKGTLDATGYATMKQQLVQLNALTGNKLLEIPEIKRILLGEGMGTGAAGVPKNVRLNNPGNLRDTKTGEFRHFSSMEEGVAAMRDDLSAKISGNSPAMKGKFGANYRPTLANVISVWAPESENDTKGYIARVAKESGLKPSHVLTQKDIEKIMGPMIRMEGGDYALSAYTPALKNSGAGTVATADTKAMSNAEKLRQLGITPLNEIAVKPPFDAAVKGEKIAGADTRGLTNQGAGEVLARNEENKPKEGKVGDPSKAAQNDAQHRLAVNAPAPSGGLAS